MVQSTRGFGLEKEDKKRDTKRDGFWLFASNARGLLSPSISTLSFVTDVLA